MGRFETPLRDIGTGLRGIRKSPLLSGAIIATLALGIGLDTGVFTLVDGMLFRARVEQHPETFVQIDLDDVRPTAPLSPGPTENSFVSEPLEVNTTSLPSPPW